MLTPQEVKRLLSDIESDRIERTISTTNTDKFGQAICAFANDLPDHNLPGYLIIGADDKTGKICRDVRITDQLLQNLGGIKTDGKLQPQVSMTVEKVVTLEGDVAVVTVQPCPFTPVRYEGRIWIRNGPRKCIASESDEKILLEKRTSRMLTFDALPCFDATLEDIDLSAFKQIYLPKAFPEEVLKTDRRTVKQQMQALGYFNVKYDCPTYAGIVMFGINPERFMPGCYVQYVRFAGGTRAGEIRSEYKFSGNLVKILAQLDTFVDASITNRRPVPVSALREEIRVDYPHWATRELLMNAICHRDYEGNGPVQFYQYDDRIEIMNPGGLYGKATPQNFPYVNDYRNGVIAEGMKVLGFVNRYSRGVQTVQDELRENGNGEADFKLHLGTAFLVIEHIAVNEPEEPRKEAEEPRKEAEKPRKEPEEPRKEPEEPRKEAEKPRKEPKEPRKEAEKPRKEPKEPRKEPKKPRKEAEGPRKEPEEPRKEAEKPRKEPKEPRKEAEKPRKEAEGPRKEPRKELIEVLELIRKNPRITYKGLMSELGIGESAVYERVRKLKENGMLRREGGRFGGKWIIIE